ncbi:MAG: hypothetical protein RR240_03940 [Burkholderiaceae bacterium]
MKKIVWFFALSLVFDAAAMAGLDDDDLARVEGRQAADTTVKVSSFRWVDEDARGGFMAFDGWHSRGATILVAEIQAEASFRRAMAALGLGLTPGFYPGGEVSHAWLPIDAMESLVTAALSSVRMGGNKASLGSFSVQRVDARGTVVWMWMH